METTEIKVRNYMRYTELFPWLVTPALVAMLGAGILSGTRLMRIP
jgi:hypothetical protein